jgi:hypothetical protein
MNRIKHILFICFFLVFFYELIQEHIPWRLAAPLNGGITMIPKPELTLDSWLSGTYQEEQMKYFEQNLSTRASLIKTHNQIAYSAFGEINAHAVEEGKNHVLFESGYIKSYMGQDFSGEEAVIQKVKLLAYVQKELKKRNVELLFVITPGKPAHLPEFISDRYDVSKRTRSNYDAYIEQFKSQQIEHIDFRNYFLKLKPATKYPLFPKCGVHWSGYGGSVAADSLFRYMKKLKNFETDYYIAGGTESNIPRYTDADIGEAMNLLWPIASDKMYYPEIIFKKDTSIKRPNVLIVGDSFVWTWISFYNYIPSLCDGKSAYWYYNQEVAWPLDTDQQPYSVKKLNLKEQTLNRDFILLVFNESSLNNCGYYFIEEMYELLNKENINN